MNRSYTIKFIAVQAIITPASIVFAHDGHGLDFFGSSHWHVSDTVGLIALAAIIALTLWLSRGSK
jgi:hypothetical protein